MPYINKIKKDRTSSEKKESDMRELRKRAYQNTAWRKLRDTYMHEHPICEECLKKGKVTPAEDIHHIQSPFKYGEINWSLLVDKDNLMALCKECHGNIHASQQGHISAEEILKQLDDLLNPDISDEELEDDNQ